MGRKDTTGTAAPAAHSTGAASAPAVPPAAPTADDAWRLPVPPNLVVFLSSLAFMLIELDAGRLMAWHVGSSLYCWTSVIAVMFAGMSAGNRVGGRLSETADPRRVLGRLFLASTAVALAMVWLGHIVALTDRDWIQAFADHGYPLPGWVKSAAEGFYDSFDRPARVVFVASVAFFPPALVLGMISPIAAAAALRTARATGKAIGGVYAYGAVGSIVGTFLAGFLLIELLGVRGLLAATALLLSVLGYAVGRQPTLTAGAAAASLILLAACAGPWKWADRLGGAILVRDVRSSVLIDESSYQYLRCDVVAHEVELADDKTGRVSLKVITDADYRGLITEVGPEAVRKTREVRSLALDHLVHGYVWLKMPDDRAGSSRFAYRESVFDASELHYTYEQVYAVMTDRALRTVHGPQPAAAVRTLSLGAGSYTFPRYLAERYPGSRHDVAEIDPAVTRACEAALRLDLGRGRDGSDSPLRAFHADARNFVEAASAAGWKYDIVYGDAFNHYSIPSHLTTEEFHEKIRSLLNPGGAYLANVIDSYESARFLSWYAATLKRTFPHLRIAAARPVKIVTTAAKGLEKLQERTCELVRFDGVRVMLADGTGRTVADLDAAEIEQFRPTARGWRLIDADGNVHRGERMAFAGGTVTLSGREDGDGRRETATLPGSEVLAVRETARTGRETFVIIASASPIDVSAFGRRPGDPRFLRSGDGRTTDTVTLLTDEEVDRLIRRTRAGTFSDDYAPVDTLLLPLFREDRD